MDLAISNQPHTRDLKTRLTRWAVLGLVVCIGLGGAGYGLWRAGWALLERSDWSRLETVQVLGVKRLQEKDIIAVSKLKRDMNIMKLPLDRVASEIEKIAGVASARVIRRLPGRVVIKVTERVPVAAIYRNQIWLVDDSGAIFPVTGPREIIDVPVLTGDFDLGKKGSVSLRNAAKLAGTIHEGFPVVFDHLAEISLVSGRFEFRLQDSGAKILAPDPSSPAVLSKLEHFLQQKGNEIPAGCEYVDLRYPAMVITGTEG